MQHYYNDNVTDIKYSFLHDSFLGIGKRDKVKKAQKKVKKAQEQLAKGHVKAAEKKLKKSQPILDKVKKMQQDILGQQQQVEKIQSATNTDTASALQQSQSNQPGQLSGSPVSSVGNSGGSSGGGGGGSDSSGYFPESNTTAPGSTSEGSSSPVEMQKNPEGAKEMEGVTVTDKKKSILPYIIAGIIIIVFIFRKKLFK